MATLIRAAARVGRSLATTASQPTGARAFSGGDGACWARRSPTRPPSARVWGDGLTGVGWALLVFVGAARGCLVLRSMTAALQVAERALLDERRPLTRDEVLAVAALPLDELPDLVALAHRVRLAYCGPEVELESLINAKSGACPEDCAFCSQSARYSTDVDVYPLLAARRGARRGPRDRATRAPPSSASWWRCGGRRSGCSTRVIDAVDAVHTETGLEVACSLGLLTEEQAQRLAAAGVKRYNHNLEAPRALFPSIVTHPHLRRPRRHRPPRHRRGHGALLRRDPRHGRDARAAGRLRVRARRARPVRGADQLPAPHRHPARRSAPDHAARGAPGHRAVPPRPPGRLAPAGRRTRVRARRAAGDGPARRRQRADRRATTSPRSAVRPRKTTRCSRRSACPWPTVPARAASWSTPPARTRARRSHRASAIPVRAE